MEMKKCVSLWLSAKVAILLAACCLVACSSEDEILDDSVKVGDTVTDFQKAKQYSETEQFDNDLDVFATYAIDIQAFRLAWWKLLSNDFADNKAFCATLDDINGSDGTANALEAYKIIDEVVENAEQYEEAFQRLQIADVLPDPTEATTRGWIADGLNFIYNCRNTQVMGRKSVMAILQNSAMGTDTQKLKELYDLLPENLRGGYSDYTSFWNAFSRGNLDSKANQIFVNLYTYDPIDFGERAKILGITPGGNITAAGAKLIESGMNLVIDVSPISTEIGYGKDLFSTFNATSDLITDGNVEGFLQSALNNAINYGPQLHSYFNYGKWEGYDLFNPEEWDVALSLEGLSSILNDAVFSDTFKEAFNNGQGERLIPNLVTAKDENGKDILLVCMIDQATGRITVGFSMDKEGNIVMNPKMPGTKEVVVIGRDGKHKKKTVIVPETGDTEVEVDLDSDEMLVEENPANGYLYLDKKSMSFSYRSEVLKTMIVTNYLYYSCTTKDDWITCSIPTDNNQLIVRVAANDTNQERKGKVTVMTTDSKGKVLNTVVLPVVQAAPEVTDEKVTASPSSLVFDGKGGKLESLITYSGGAMFTGIDYDSELAGWLTIDTKDAYDGFFTLVADAKANETGKERSGTITIYAAYNQQALDNAMQGNVDPTLVLSTTILVKQSAAEETKWRNDPSSILLGISVYGKGTGGDVRKFGTTTMQLKWAWTEIDETDDFNVTRNSNGFIINAMRTLTGTSAYPYDKIVRKISFSANRDKDDQYGDIQNLKVEYESTSEDGIVRWALEASAVERNYTEWSKTTGTAWWNVSEKKGNLKITSFSAEEQSKTAGTKSYSLTPHEETEIVVNAFFPDRKK